MQPYSPDTSNPYCVTTTPRISGNGTGLTRLIGCFDSKDTALKVQNLIDSYDCINTNVFTLNEYQSRWFCKVKDEDIVSGLTEKILARIIDVLPESNIDSLDFTSDSYRAPLYRTEEGEYRNEVKVDNEKLIEIKITTPKMTVGGLYFTKGNDSIVLDIEKILNLIKECSPGKENLSAKVNSSLIEAPCRCYQDRAPYEKDPNVFVNKGRAFANVDGTEIAISKGIDIKALFTLINSPI